MSFFEDVAERVRAGEDIPGPLAALLTAATPIQMAGMWMRLHGSRVSLDARVISYGNISAGGTGKTPAVIERVRTEQAAGRGVAVLTRGYGAPKESSQPILAKGEEAARMWETLGDEPALIGRKAPGAIIARSPDRIAAGREAIQRFGCDTLILDDGFQYVRLEREENIVVIDATKPFGNGHIFPRGILREPLRALGRATQVILTHCDVASDLSLILEALDQYCPHAPIRKTRHAAASLWRVCDGALLALSDIQGVEVTALCAIGNPAAFYATLEELGALVTTRLAFRDHAVIPRSAVPDKGLVITTEKDAVRMPEVRENVAALEIELRDV